MRPPGSEVAQAYAVLNDPARRARYDETLLDRSAPARSAVASRRLVVTPSVRRGIFELSPSKAQHLALHPPTFRDGHRRTITLPAGTGHGDQITLLYDNYRVTLTVRLQ